MYFCCHYNNKYKKLNNINILRDSHACNKRDNIIYYQIFLRRISLTVTNSPCAMCVFNLFYFAGLWIWEECTEQTQSASLITLSLGPCVCRPTIWIAISDFYYLISLKHVPIYCCGVRIALAWIGNSWWLFKVCTGDSTSSQDITIEFSCLSSIHHTYHLVVSETIVV